MKWAVVAFLASSVCAESNTNSIKLSVDVKEVDWWPPSEHVQLPSRSMYLILSPKDPRTVPDLIAIFEANDDIPKSSVRYIPDDAVRVYGSPAAVLNLVGDLPLSAIFEYDRDAPLDTTLRRSVTAYRTSSRMRARSANTSALPADIFLLSDATPPSVDPFGVVGWLIRGAADGPVRTAAEAAAAAARAAGAVRAWAERITAPTGARMAAYVAVTYRVRAVVGEGGTRTGAAALVEGAVGDAAVGAASGGLVWVERDRVGHVMNNIMTSTVQSEVADKRPFWDAGLNGTGQLLAVGDTGVDWDSCFFRDDAIAGGKTIAYWPNVDWRHRKIISLKRCEDSQGRLTDMDWAQGHGTHVAGSAIGDVLPGNTNICPSCKSYNGLAFGARAYVEDLSCGNSPVALSVPGDFVIYFTPPYDVGCRVHVNSWGTELANEYLATDAETDLFTLLHNDYLPIFAAGNTGPGKGVLSPAASKNVLSVGSHANEVGPRRDSISRFSSHGPLYDGRVKPEIVAPGEPIKSAGADGNLNTRQCTFVSKQGTSMATPAIAAAAVLLRQYLVEGWYPTGRPVRGNEVPFVSGMLMRAVLIAGSDLLASSVPSHLQGFGALALHKAVPLTPTLPSVGHVGLWFHDAHNDATGAIAADARPATWCLAAAPLAAEGSVPQRIRVALAWVDPPAAEHAKAALVNDIDLTVTVVRPDGSQQTVAVNPSITSSPDRVNTVEVALLDSAAAALVAAGAVIRVSVSVHIVRQGLGPARTVAYAVAVNARGFANPTVVPCPATVVCASADGAICGGRGTCRDGTCVCAHGYGGAACTECSSVDLCGGRGRCTPHSTCVCDGNYAGPSCSECKPGFFGPTCASQCRCNTGTCNATTGVCDCPPTRSGRECGLCARDTWSRNPKTTDCDETGVTCLQDGQLSVRTAGRSSGYLISNQERLSPKLSNCTWTVVPTAGPPGGADAEIPGARVDITWERFETEDPYDPVTVSLVRPPEFIYGVPEPCRSGSLQWEWVTAKGPWCTVVMGKRAPPITPPEAGPLTVCYQSDLYSPLPGFIAKWTVVPPPCGATTCDASHGACEGGVCVCKGGYLGSDCRTPPGVVSPCVSPSSASSGACSGHGVCDPYAPVPCRCEIGFRGRHCEVDSAVPTTAPPPAAGSGPAPRGVPTPPLPPPRPAPVVAPSPPPAGAGAAPFSPPPPNTITPCPTLVPYMSTVWQKTAAAAVALAAAPWSSVLRANCPLASCAPAAAPYSGGACVCPPPWSGALCHYNPSALPTLAGPLAAPPVPLRSAQLVRAMAVSPPDAGAVAAATGARAGQGVAAVVVGDALADSNAAGADVGWVRLVVRVSDPFGAVTADVAAWPQAWSALAFLRAAAVGTVTVRISHDAPACVDVPVAVRGAVSGLPSGGANGTVVLLAWDNIAAGIAVAAHPAPPVEPARVLGVHAVACSVVPASVDPAVGLLSPAADQATRAGYDFLVGVACGLGAVAVVMFVFRERLMRSQ